jgi:hypothetical protein
MSSDHPLVLVTATIPTTPSLLRQPSFESGSGSLEPSENMSITMAHHDVQADSNLVALTGSESTVRFVQVDSSELVGPAGKLEVQVGLSNSLTSVIMMSPRESPFAINGDRPSHAGDSDSPPELDTIRVPTSLQTAALSPTSELCHDDDDPAALRKSKAQSVCLASLNVKNREVVSTHRKEASAVVLIVAHILARQGFTSLTESQSCATIGEAHHDT